MPGGKKGNQKDKEQGEEGGNFKFDFANKEAVNSLMPLLQKKVNNLVGSSSGYLESLPLTVQRRIKALRKLHKEHSTLEEQYRNEREELEKKYHGLKAPLYHKRSEIVIGHREPTDDELLVEEKKEEEEKETKDEKVKKETPPSGEDIKGIPEFWLSALKHHDDFMDMITPEDEAALKHLIDIKWTPVEKEETPSPSFVLEFHFHPNEFFDEVILKKTYMLREDPEMNDVMFENSSGTPITWKKGKNLTKKMVTKQQKSGGKRGGKKGKGGQGQTRTITVEEDVPSFFHFFSPIELPEEDEDEDEDEMERLQEMLSEDYEVGLSVKSALIPNALLWFAGEVPTYGDMYGGGYDDEDGEDGEEGEEGEEYNSEDDDDFDPKVHAPQGGNAGAQPECKQQ